MFRYRPNIDQHDKRVPCDSLLSPRLQHVHDLVPTLGNHCDVATGHGQLLVALARSSPERRLQGTDRSAAEVAEARRLIAAHSLSNHIELSTSDTLPVVSGTWSLSITGLGGRSMAALLRRHPSATRRFSRMILQPNRDEELVRAAVHSLGYAPEGEHVVYDRGYGYLILDCAPISPSNPPQTNVDCLCGRSVSEAQNGLRAAYYDWRIAYHTDRLRGAQRGGDWQTTESSYRAIRLLTQARGR